jgi:hypothetical protein
VTVDTRQVAEFPDVELEDFGPGAAQGEPGLLQAAVEMILDADHGGIVRLPFAQGRRSGVVTKERTFYNVKKG